MELILLRHGIPVEPEHWTGSEQTRPLTPQGRDQVRAVILALQAAGRLPARRNPFDEIWTSPLIRCQETAQLVTEALGAKSPRLVAGLASGADLVASLPTGQGDPARWPQRLLCVGHQPDLGILIDELTGGPSGEHGLGRAGSASLSGEFAPGGMRLNWLLTAEAALRSK